MSGNTSATGGFLVPTSLPPLDDDSLVAVLHDFVVGITGLAPTLVFPRWQPQPPTMPAATVNWGAVGVLSHRPIGNWPQMDHFPGYSVQREHWLMEVMATFYGPQSGGYASQFFAGMTIRQNLEMLNPFGIKLHSTGDISRVPELINTQYVSRADVMFHLVREIDRTYNILDVADMTVTISTDDSPAPVATGVTVLP